MEIKYKIILKMHYIYKMLFFIIYSINAHLKLYNIKIIFLRVKTLWGNKTQIMFHLLKNKCVHKYKYKTQVNKITTNKLQLHIKL